MIYILFNLSKINFNHLDSKPCNFLIQINNKNKFDEYEIKLFDFGTIKLS